MSKRQEEAQEDVEPRLSQLQEKILRIVCTRLNVDYALLMQETNRDRVTVAQSVDSLAKHKYVKKDKINPEYEKSKLIIRPTFSAKHHAWRFLGVSLEDILKIEDNEQIAAYLEFIKDIHDASQRQKLIRPLEDFLLLYEAWTTDGKLYRTQTKEILKRGLNKGIFELVQDRNYDAKELLNKRSIDWLKKLFSSQEIKELRHVIVQMKDKLLSTADRLPE
ncbi:MAG: hypothetical protein WAM14_13355 [Candidatus Nitrosopolaris sp.]